MRKIIIYAALITTAFSFAQKRETKSFTFQESKIEYDRIDYSKYTVASFFITMYNDVEENEKMMKKAIRCLKRKSNLYHTLYYFIKIPKGIETLDNKNELFSAFVNHLKEAEELKKINLYVNFDSDYSLDYKSNHQTDYKIKRVTTDIKPKEICETLTIR